MSAAALSSAPLAARARVASAKPLRARKAAFSPRVASATVAAATPAEQSNIVVIGGTGGTGAECVVQALKRGAKVTVLARTPSKMVQPPGSGGADEGKPISDPNLTVVQGDVCNAADVAKIITEDVTGVVVSLGGKTKDVGKTMLTDGTLNVINAMKNANVRRVAVVTSIGAGDPPIRRRSCFASHEHGDAIHLRRQEQPGAAVPGPAGPGRDLEFCIVRPGGLGTGPPTGVINVIDGEAGSIARADVADFCLGALFEDAFPYIGKAPCISSVGGTSWVKDRGGKGMMEA